MTISRTCARGVVAPQQAMRSIVDPCCDTSRSSRTSSCGKARASACKHRAPDTWMSLTPHSAERETESRAPARGRRVIQARSHGHESRLSLGEGVRPTPSA